MIAQLVARSHCLGCDSTALQRLSSGAFHDEPLRRFIASDPWGEDPLDSLHGLRWEYVACTQCSLAFHRWVLSPEWTRIKYTRWQSAEAIEQFNRQNSSSQDLFERGVHLTKHALQLETITRHLRAKDPVRVLDFGCGHGEFIEQCRLYGMDAVGVDRSTERQERSRVRIFTDLAQVDGQFHAVTLFEVLEHLEEPRVVLEALRERLVEGGILVLETPDTTGVTDIKTLRDYRMIHPLDHINGFTPSTLRAFAERLGFEAMSPPVSHVTTDVRRVLKTEAKKALRFAARERTQQYFRKC